MAKRIAPRFDALLAKDLSDKDRIFAESLYASYKKKKQLTAGRRTWLGKLEEKYTDEKVAERQSNLNGSDEATRIDTLLSRDDMNAWEQKFLNSIRDSVASYGKLSEKQATVLERIEGEHDDDKLNEWRDRYQTELRPLAVIVAEYYITTPYFNREARAILNPDHVPTEREYKRVCENKYAKRVIRAHESDAKYPIDTMVEARKNASWRCPLRGKQGFIIQVDVEAVTRAAKGSKKYLVLPIGEVNTVVCEERDIKKVRGQ